MALSQRRPVLIAMNRQWNDADAPGIDHLDQRRRVGLHQARGGAYRHLLGAGADLREGVHLNGRIRLQVNAPLQEPTGNWGMMYCPAASASTRVRFVTSLVAVTLAPLIIIRTSTPDRGQHNAARGAGFKQVRLD